MKFAKELEQDLVPEWRAKYLDYKTGKKKVKAVSRALAKLNRTPGTPGRFRRANQNRTPEDESFARTTWESRSFDINAPRPDRAPHEDEESRSRLSRGSSNTSGPLDIAGSAPPPISEHQPLNARGRNVGRLAAPISYGSIVPSPPSRSYIGPPSLELPDPAISAAHDARAWNNSDEADPPLRRTASTAGDAYEVGRTHTPSKLATTLLPRSRRIFQSRRAVSTPDVIGSTRRSPRIRKILTSRTPATIGLDVPLEAYKEFDVRQADFFVFLDKELKKIETFYKMKEDEATEKLELLRQQLHEMRDRRLEEVYAEQQKKENHHKELENLHSSNGNGKHGIAEQVPGAVHPPTMQWIKPIEHAIGIGSHRFGKNTRALQQMGSPNAPKLKGTAAEHPDARRDFSRRPTPNDVSYRAAKRKLKVALQEFYRGLELLKSYALLNRTAFRKINKKYDKAVQARPTGRYMAEKVNKAWFVNSDIVDGFIVNIEDLYARYFERGNHKIAVGKLRSKHARGDAYMGTVFINGLFVAAGTVLGIQGLVYGVEHLESDNIVTALNTSYLLQIYGGYFLALLLFILFCLDCRVWTRAKINYVFVFEFDGRHNLDWRQLVELPCMFLFFFGLAMWLNFQQPGTNTMFIYWPVVLILITVVIVFFPGPVIFHKSRQWWAYSNFRLFLAGLYPVEFRDFFLGDMYCSLTYAMGNIELFFCLYARAWNDPGQCNSTHSRLLGFFSTLPAIFRALQCLRRYYDTQNAFPHLVNCGKYTFTILFYMTLSLYRIDEFAGYRALFITCATINSIYCSIWDVAMDWSLGNPYAANPYLRDVLGYKRPWVYYIAMIIDPLLRFNWIFYAIFVDELQHSAVLSFAIGVSEVCRRGMWTLFRLENEHCTNVGKYRASRDVPLPYDLSSRPLTPSDEPHLPRTDYLRTHTRNSEQGVTARDGVGDLEQAITSGSAPSTGTARRRNTMSFTPDTPIARGIARVGTMMAAAHAEDFERKRRPGISDGEATGDEDENERSSDEAEEEEEEEAAAMATAAEEANVAEMEYTDDVIRRYPSARDGE